MRERKMRTALILSSIVAVKDIPHKDHQIKGTRFEILKAVINSVPFSLRKRMGRVRHHQLDAVGRALQEHDAQPALASVHISAVSNSGQ
ncbi:hypothetical protein EVAR_46695_1 [Eumeta japonica]|uniref:Uncharacterized protein n=1 Tax=Eumeta variegata TaxID=151549 RepID=A0A4C1Y3V4_EUMVA|nr:hypothetical protein EVAR_46695_1 [Eumeta japonica]